MPRRNVIWLMGTGLASFFLWAAAQGSIAPPRGPLQFVDGFPGAGDDYEGMALMLDVWRTVQRNYVVRLDAEKSRQFWEDAVGAGVHGLDIHSAFIGPKEREEFEKSSRAEFVGVGVRIVSSVDEKRLVVLSPIVGSPAFRAGIKAGDHILKVDDQTVGEIKADEAARLIQGKPGTEVTLTIYRATTGETFKRTLLRELIEIESVLGDRRGPDHAWDFMLSREDGIAYIRLAAFTEKTVRELRAALRSLRDENIRGLILDVRRNPGGLLRSAVDVANMFISEGTIVTVESRGKSSEIYQADPKAVILPSTPIAILIDEESASASEILAAALQDHKRAVVVGTRSYGKGSVQKPFPLENGKSILKLTTARYLRPNGKNVSRTGDRNQPGDWGVVPDIEVRLTPEEVLSWRQLRDDRDVVRDSQTPEQQADHLGRALLAWGLFWSASTPAGLTPLTVDLAWGQYHANQLPRIFEDRVRDRAYEELVRRR